MVKNLIPWKRKTEELAEASSTRHPLQLLHQQMNNLFDNFFEDVGLESLEGAMVSPRCEVSETDSDIRVRVEAPGMEKDDIELLLDENVLTIRGEKKEETEDKHRDYYVSEVRYGRFSRSVPLPAGIDQANAKAKFKRGVLTLTLPKTGQAQAERKQIPIATD